MGSINNAILDNGLLIADVLAFLKEVQDPKKLDSIKDSIISINSLNDTEKKKVQETRAWIQVHAAKQADVAAMDQQLIATQTKIDRLHKELTDRTTGETEKMENEASANRKILEDAREAKAQAELRHKEADDREEQLQKDKSAHEDRVIAYKQEKADLDKQRKELNDLSATLRSLEKQTKDKLAALQSFNF